MGGDDFLTVVGIRGDEPKDALPKMRSKDIRCALWQMLGLLREGDVRGFWDKQEFDPSYAASRGVNNPLSNCDLCFKRLQHKAVYRGA